MGQPFGVPLGIGFGVGAGASLSTAALIGVVNDGTVETPVVLGIVGPIVDPQVTMSYPAGDSQALVFDGEISAGDELVVDTKDKTVLLNGTANRRSLLVTGESDWFLLPPGACLLTLSAFSSGPGAGLRATWRSARQ